jgi:hypothetical protein
MEKRASEVSGMARETVTDRRSEREVVVTRTFDAPARLVFEAWTTPELLMKWWTPKSFGITFISCEADVRPGGTYRFVMGHPTSISRWRSSAGISKWTRQGVSSGPMRKAKTAP